MPAAMLACSTNAGATRLDRFGSLLGFDRYSVYVSSSTSLATHSAPGSPTEADSAADCGSEHRREAPLKIVSGGSQRIETR
eukprot:1825560-Alexandrium_andersonii.AAC.1